MYGLARFKLVWIYISGNFFLISPKNFSDKKDSGLLVLNSSRLNHYANLPKSYSYEGVYELRLKNCRNLTSDCVQ